MRVFLICLAVGATAGALLRPLHAARHGSAMTAAHRRGALLHVAAARHGAVTLMAKKGGKGKKKGGKKGGKEKSGFAWASNFELKPFESTALREVAELLVSSYQTRTGKALHPSLSSASDVPKALWSAPTAVLVAAAAAPAVDEAGAAADSADAPADAAPGDAVCLYANAAALEAHGLGADAYGDLIGSELPLPLGMAKKYESGYEKKLPRVGQLRDAERLQLEKLAVVDGKLAASAIGVAYVFGAWELEDGTTCKPGGVRVAKALTAEEISELVGAQAAEVRRLKEEEGLGNSDPAVKSAVAELLRLKALQEEVAAAREAAV